MIKSLGQELLSQEILSQDDAVVVGVSGGADSIALLHLLLALNETQGWRLKVHVAHFNHQLRGVDADGDAAFVAAVADSLALPYTIDSRNIEQLAGDEPGGVEELGRRERYAFFERVCITVRARIVAVGHHAEDNAETILYRILRGTGVRGLAGIPAARPISAASDIRLIRPLLKHSRNELRAYLSDAGIAFREDRTNASNEPMRNLIRNDILPKLEETINPQVRSALLRLGEQARWMDEYLAETVHRTFESLIISHTDQALSLNAEALSRKSKIVQTELIRLAYRSFGLGEQDLAFSHLTSALDLIADPASGKQIQLPQGMTIHKRYHELIFSLPSEEPRETIADEIAIHLPGKTLLPIRRLEIECTIEDVNEADIARLRQTQAPTAEHVDFDSVHAPLVVRRRRPGDRFTPLGAPGSKKLSDFLVDTKVSPEARERVAVLCDQLGPIWIIGHRIDDRVKLTALTRRVLHLRAGSLER